MPKNTKKFWAPPVGVCILSLIVLKSSNLGKPNISQVKYGQTLFGCNTGNATLYFKKQKISFLLKLPWLKWIKITLNKLQWINIHTRIFHNLVYDWLVIARTTRFPLMPQYFTMLWNLFMTLMQTLIDFLYFSCLLCLLLLSGVWYSSWSDVSRCQKPGCLRCPPSPDGPEDTGRLRHPTLFTRGKKTCQQLANFPPRWHAALLTHSIYLQVKKRAEEVEAESIILCLLIQFLGFLLIVCNKWIKRQMPYLWHSCGCCKWKLCLPGDLTQTPRVRFSVRDITLLLPDPLRFHQTARPDRAERHQFVCNNLKYAGTCYLRHS